MSARVWKFWPRVVETCVLGHMQTFRSMEFYGSLTIDQLEINLRNQILSMSQCECVSVLFLNS